MAEVSKITVKIGADTKDLRKELDSAKKETSKFGDSVKKIGGLIAGAFAVSKLIDFTKKVTAAADVQLKAEAQLLTALDGREGAQKRLIQQAQELQTVTLFGDEETIKAQALIAAFVKEEEQIKKIIPLVQDMAAAKGMALASAADLVAKTLGSEANALSRYGIKVEGAVGSTDRLNTMVNGLSEAFKGQAKTLAQTGMGGVQQFQNMISDIEEDIGKKLIPVLNEATLLITQMINNWKKFKDYFTLKNQIDDADQLSTNLQVIALMEFRQAKESFTELMDAIVIDDPVISLEANFKGLRKSILDSIDAGAKLIPMLTAVKQKVDNVGVSMDETGLGADFFAEKFREQIGNIHEAVNSLSQAFTLYFNKKLQDETLTDTARKKLLKKQAQTDKALAIMSATVNVANAVTKAMIAGPVVGQILAGITAGLGAAQIAIIASTPIPSFAQGGLVTQPTLAMVGDNPGKKEAIIPSEMFGKMGMNGNVRFIIEGDKLVGVIDRYNRNLNTFA